MSEAVADGTGVGGDAEGLLARFATAVEAAKGGDDRALLAFLRAWSDEGVPEALRERLEEVAAVLFDAPGTRPGWDGATFGLLVDLLPPPGWVGSAPPPKIDVPAPAPPPARRGPFKNAPVRFGRGMDGGDGTEHLREETGFEYESAAPEAAAPAESEPVRAPEPEPVHVRGSAPRAVRPGDSFVARFAAYVKEAEARAERALHDAASDPAEVRPGLETGCRWAKGARVTVRCSARGLQIPRAQESFLWNGEMGVVEFDVDVPDDAKPRRTVLVIEAFVHDAPDAPQGVEVARLRMEVEVTTGAADSAPTEVRAAAARTAFASYASQDRVDVLERVSSIRRSTGMDIFVDRTTLKMDEEWEPALGEHIRSRERFLLFWSEFAERSKWVRKEMDLAIETHGLDAVELHLLRHVPAEKIPEPLRHRNFDDVYLLAIDAELYRRGAPTP
jgi:hypothetical protein